MPLYVLYLTLSFKAYPEYILSDGFTIPVERCHRISFLYTANNDILSTASSNLKK